MNDFNSLDLKHKRAVICHVKSFRTAIERLGEYVPAQKREALINDVAIESRDFVNFLSDKDVHEIVKEIEDNLNNVIK